MKLKLLVIIMQLLNIFLHSQIKYVPTDYSNIQDAINNSVNGDSILIEDGIYSDIGFYNITWDANEKHLIIKSLNGPNNCVIDCNYLGRAFLLNNNQNNSDIIEGLTIKNGWAKTEAPIISGGGAILCDGTSPQIINCILEHNIAGDTVNSIVNSYYADGGAIDCINGSSPVIKNNTIKNNFANHTGGGIHFGDRSFGLVMNNIIDNNRNYGCYGGGGIALVFMSNPIIVNNQITNNNARYYSVGGYGGGIICMNSDPLIINNTIANNSTINGTQLGEGGGIRIRGLPSPKIINCILWGNEAKDSLENLDFQYSWVLDVSYSNIGGGLYNIISPLPLSIIDADPLFCSSDDYQLCVNSPCIDAGNPDTSGLSLPTFDIKQNNRIINSRIDMGAYEYVFPTNILNDNILPSEFKLYQNYPNPFNPTTNIEFFLPKKTMVSLIITDILGNYINEIFNKSMDSGLHNYSLNARNLPCGVYFYTLKSNEYISTKKMIVLK
jgi:hypothetical protein